MIRNFFFGWQLVGLILLPFVVLADTDSVDVSLVVNCDGGNCSSSISPPPAAVLGCTDPAATNYNSSATQNDGSCQYPPTMANVSNFSATYEPAGARVRLNWINPTAANFAAVRIVRATSAPATDPQSGTFIYDGSDEQTYDTAIVSGQTYFYTAFARDSNGLYASGAVASVTVPGEEVPPEEEDDEPPPIEDIDGDGFPDVPDPFSFLPDAGVVDDPVLARLELGDFLFLQTGERPQYLSDRGQIFIQGEKDLTVLIRGEKLPEALKTIGVTITDPSDPRRSFSFLLRRDLVTGVYSARLGPFARPGLYPVYISIINFQNQSIKRLRGQLLVAGAGVVTSPLQVVTDRVVSPVVIASGLAVGVAESFSLFSHIGSLYDLYLLILHFFNALWRFLGWKRRSKFWGTVYDSVTKRPLDPAYVVVRQNGQDVNTAITDLDGRYGFFLPDGAYSLLANKTHYQFPSVKLNSRASDELYDHLYYGQTFKNTAGEVINWNIPLDPVAFDWNEFAKDKRGFFILHSKKEKRRQRIVAAIYGFGLILALRGLLFAPSWINIAVIILYLLTPAGRWWWRRKRSVISVTSVATGLPLPFAIVRAFAPGVNQQIRSVVADQFGRLFFLTPPGDYYFTVEEKQVDGSYKQVYQTPTLNLERGLLDRNLVIP
ncbi:MAG: carboxypeptidase-like regulatory domain-containing protein [Patescibacteria group bacterium]